MIRATDWKTKARRTLATCMLAATAGLLSACQTTSHTGQAADPATTGSIDAVEEPSLKATAAAAKDWQKNPKDIRSGLRYAHQLKLLGQKSRQIAVLKKLVAYHPRDMALRFRLGRALLEGGRSVQAEGTFRAMIQAGQRDWRTYNALGSALAAQGRFAEARAQYALALRAAPKNAKVINNIALSHILEGNPAKAETMLREALATPEGRREPRIRQNLALALGLQGRFKEARYIASQDLPPAEVEANMAYLKQMLGSGTDTWSKLRRQG